MCDWDEETQGYERNGPIKVVSKRLDSSQKLDNVKNVFELNQNRLTLFIYLVAQMTFVLSSIKWLDRHPWHELGVTCF